MSLLTNAFCGQEPYIDELYVTSRQSHEDKLLSSIIVHMAIVIISKSNEGLLKLFNLLLTSPSQLEVSLIHVLVCILKLHGYFYFDYNISASNKSGGNKIMCIICNCYDLVA